MKMDDNHIVVDYPTFCNILNSFVNNDGESDNECESRNLKQGGKTHYKVKW